jgi:hypothetical protein
MLAADIAFMLRPQHKPNTKQASNITNRQQESFVMQTRGMVAAAEAAAAAAAQAALDAEALLIHVTVHSLYWQGEEVYALPRMSFVITLKNAIGQRHGMSHADQEIRYLDDGEGEAVEVDDVLEDGAQLFLLVHNRAPFRMRLWHNRRRFPPLPLV